MFNAVTPGVMPALHPYLNLAQSNMELLTRFAMSREVVGHSVEYMQNVLQQSQKFTTQIAQTQAFGALMQGILRNYGEFLTQASQSGIELVSMGQQALFRQAQETAEDVIDAASDPRPRTSRKVRDEA